MNFGVLFSIIFAFFTQNDPQIGDFSCFFWTPNRLKLQIAENAKTFIFLRKNMVFCMSGLPFWHSIFIKISTFFKNGFGIAFWRQISRFLTPKGGFWTPLGAPWRPNWRQKSSKIAKMTSKNFTRSTKKLYARQC